MAFSAFLLKCTNLFTEKQTLLFYKKNIPLGLRFAYVFNETFGGLKNLGAGQALEKAWLDENDIEYYTQGTRSGGDTGIWLSGTLIKAIQDDDLALVERLRRAGVNPVKLQTCFESQNNKIK